MVGRKSRRADGTFAWQ